ncbi:ketoacyl-ACP synthase III [Micromonospora sp. PPF5-17]|uniref:Ketoacyl-ACP synthase III n=2 Tax=Micromonosporaceae TaxID=28056 RepID=A0ABX9WJI8_9ACTN|nr:ketoacyl-ACP synthase III [Micromonospora sp. PPF5-17B]NES35849.1 ketoacyl-ACP synthase III [Micromonospora solifontis]NES57999.1 ketoacyl-ACP synthase III [Micromonospora sp. PPF5-6]RNM00340.1 ketoacyl-ACP synthase III [Micromonospora solifontis]
MDRPAVSVLATGSYVPAREVSNDEVARRVGVDAEWIERKTHIRSRRFAGPDEATSDLAARAAERALAQAGMDAGRLDHIIVATSTGDSPQPPTAHAVQRLIGARNAAAMDLNVVCSGFVYAMTVACGLLAIRPGTRALVVAADLYSRILDFTDRTTSVLFGDGAGAAILTSGADAGILDFELRAQGDARNLIWIEAGGSRQPASHQTVESGGHYFRMRGREVRDFVAREVPPALRNLLLRNGMTPYDVQHFVPHQANGVMLDELVKATDLTAARTHRTLERYGNVGSASVAVTLDEAHRNGHLRPGELVLLAGFGGGMAIGACLLRWTAPAVPSSEDLPVATD